MGDVEDFFFFLRQELPGSDLCFVLFCFFKREEPVFCFFVFFLINLFIFGCVGSSFLCKGFL